MNKNFLIGGIFLIVLLFLSGMIALPTAGIYPAISSLSTGQCIGYGGTIWKMTSQTGSGCRIAVNTFNESQTDCFTSTAETIPPVECPTITQVQSTPVTTEPIAGSTVEFTVPVDTTVPSSPVVAESAISVPSLSPTMPTTGDSTPASGISPPSSGFRVPIVSDVLDWIISIIKGIKGS